MLFYAAMPSGRESSMLAGIRRLPRAEGALPGAAHVDDLGVAVHQIDHALRSEILELAGDKPVGVLITGGLDSAVVAAVAAATTGVRPLLVALRGGLSSVIEERLQDSLAQVLGSDLLVLDDWPEFHVQPLIERNGASDFPSGGCFTHVWRHATLRAAAAGVQVLLTGEGGNERFSPGANLARDLFPWHPVEALAQVGRSRDASTSLSGFVRAQWVTSGLSAVKGPPGRERGQDLAGDSSAMLGWLGPYRDDWSKASGRRRKQMSQLRGRGFGWADADALVALERHDLFDAGEGSVLPVFAPLSSGTVGRAVASVHPSLRNPVGVSLQDKHLLRLVARRYLPASVTEMPKIGVLNQIAVLTRGHDIWGELDSLREGWEWLGLEIDRSFGRPDLQAASSGFLWTRLLAAGAWALNAVRGPVT